MFIRRTLTRRTGGQDYHSYRLVHNERDGDKVRQRTLLNLGSDFDLPKEAWPELCRRIDESLNGQAPIIDDTPAVVEEEAQRIVAQLLARGRAGDAEAVRAPVPVDVASLACTRPRSVGVEQVGLWAAERLGLMELLSTLGINRSLCTAAVASRERKRRFESEAALAHRTRSGGVVHLEKVDDAEAGEVRLYCYSEQRAEKERGMAERFAQRLERGLDALNEGLSRPRTQKKPEKIWQRIGRLLEKSRGVGQHYDITVATDESGKRALAVTFCRKPVARTMLTHPGVYCLCSNETDWSEERLWRTFTLLTEVEAVFRSLKSEPGLRPIHHHKPRRAEGHLFITVIAYQLVQVIRTRLAERGDESNRTASAATLKRILGGRQRVTVTFKRTDGRTLHVRKATRPEPQQKAILDTLGITSSAGGTQTAVV